MHLTHNQIEDLEQILGEFDGILREPKELPHIRHRDHKIPIKEGVDPINVKLYRYPHLMKAEC